MNFSVASVSPQPVNNWTVSNGTITAGQGSTNIDVTWGSGTGTVTVNASNGCGTSSTRSQSYSGISCRDEETFNVQRSKFNVYPNPVHDIVTVSVDEKNQTNYTIQLMDAAGRTVLTEIAEATPGMNIYELNLSQLSKGIYMVEIKSSDESWKKKVVVE